MIESVSKFLFRLTAAVAAALTVVIAAAAWRLSAGPVSLAPLTPYVQEGLSYGGEFGFRVALDDTILSWAGWDRTIDIRALGVRMLSPDGTLVARVPEVSLGLKVRPLLRGHIRPTRIDLIGAQALLIRNLDGSIGFGVGAGLSADLQAYLAALADEFLKPPDRSRDAGYLSRVSIINSSLSIVDRRAGSLWRAPRAEVVLARSAEGLTGTGALDLAVDGHLQKFTATAVYTSAARRAQVQVAFADLEPALFSRRGGALARLSGLQVPVSGTIDFSVGAGGAMAGIAFDVTGGAGFVELPELLPGKITVVQASARGRVPDDFSEVRFDELFVDTGGPKITTSMSIGWTGGSSTAKMKSTLPGATLIKVEGGVRDLPVDELAAYWPARVSSGARQWVIANVHGGSISEARFRAAFDLRDSTDDDKSGDDFDLTFTFGGVAARYFAPLPELNGASGTGHLNPTKFELKVDRGSLAGLAITEGALVVSGLDTTRQRMAISFVASGTAREAMTILDRKPLEFARAIRIRPSEVGGLVAVRARFGLDITRSLSPKDVDFAAAANLVDAEIPSAFQGAGLYNGEIKLRLDRNGLEADGSVMVKGVPFVLSWREDFRPEARFATYYALSGRLDAKARERFSGAANRYLHGPVNMQLHVMGSRNRIEQSVLAVDLADTAITIPEFKWSKPVGTAGTVRATMTHGRDGGLVIDAFQIEMADMRASGEAELDAEQRLRRLDFADLSFGRTRLSAAIRPQAPHGYIIALNGASLDFEPYLREFLRAGDDAPLPPLRVSVRVDQMLLGAGQRLVDVVGNAVHDGESWSAVTATGAFAGAGKAITLAIVKEKTQRKLTVTTEDAGSFVRTLGAYDNAIGGSLNLTAVIEDGLPNRPVKGHVQITDFKVVRAPVLAQIMTLASLGGIRDLLNGEGISFVRFEAPFTLADGALAIDGARAFGPALGVTMEGALDLDRQELAFNGTIVPSYTLNSLLGNIPILGNILVGKKGEGVFALTYQVSGPAEEPRVTVNPLAALAPGFLRGFFSMFEGTVPQGTVLPDATEPVTPD